MTQIDVDGYLEDKSGKRVPFRLSISEPRRSTGGENCYCVVHAPALQLDQTRIFGYDERQARELAIYFVLQLIDDRRVIDEKGNAIEIS